MSAAFEYEDMHHLVDRLTPTQVRRLRLLVTQDAELARLAGDLSAQPEPQAPTATAIGLRALIGAIAGPLDMAEGHDGFVLDRMRERFGNSA